MTTEQWVDHVGFLLVVNEVSNFTPTEICTIGKMHEDSVLEMPPPELLQNAILLANGPLSWVRDHMGVAPITVNSWYRSTAYNHAVGGTEHSMHLTCGAADITKAGWTPDRLADALHNQYPEADSLGIGLYKTFVHVDIRGLIGRTAPARWPGDGVEAEWWDQ